MHLFACFRILYFYRLVPADVRLRNIWITMVYQFMH